MSKVPALWLTAVLAAAAASPASAAARTRRVLKKKVEACPQIERMFTRVDAVVWRQARRDARSVAKLDKYVQQYKKPILKHGTKAIPCLSGIALDAKRTEKSRLWALTFLSFIKHPSVFQPMRAVLHDPKAPAELRSAAASYLPIMKGICEPGTTPEQSASRCILRKDVYQALCATFEDRTLPWAPMREVLVRVSAHGCTEAGPLEYWIKLFGKGLSGDDYQNAHLAILALAHAEGRPATRVLLNLLDFYPLGTKGRKLVYRALAEKGDILPYMKETITPLLSDSAQAETGPMGQRMVLQLMVLVRDPASTELFLKFLDHRSPAVVAEAAAGLAAVGAKDSLPVLEQLLVAADTDPRFAPKKKGDAPAFEHIDRIRQAVDDLWAQTR